MTKWDKEYINLCKKILNEGIETENRTVINTVKIPSYHFQLNVGEEFPVLTTKQLFFRQAITEMLWIYQAQSNDVRWLQERNVTIWDEWEIDEDGIWRAEQRLPDKDGNLIKQKIEKNFGKEYAHTIGTAYGYIVNKYKLIDKLINTLNNNPKDRRMVISLWQDAFLDTAVLPSCVWSNEWDVTDNKLNMWVHQRSCDVALGLPFNVTQYAVLLSLIAHVTGFEVGTIDWSIKDAHLYVNHINNIKEQIRRYDELGDLKGAELWINKDIDDFYKFDNSRELKDIKIKKYKHHGPLKFDRAQ
ncbi:MAG: thymidylate synthase [Bacilli bacterium]|nr:thymidylate synthase [Bacilli bacterium]